jgi:hypothetical protein
VPEGFDPHTEDDGNESQLGMGKCRKCTVRNGSFEAIPAADQGWTGLDIRG